MIVLGIESTAHTFGVGIIDASKKRYGEKAILANAKHVYTTEKGGIIPIEAAKHHKHYKQAVLETALNQADVNFNEIDVVAYSRGPGLAPCLLVGLETAKQIALKANAPLVGVNHCIAHLEITQLVCKAKNPVLLYTSGANTQVIAYAAGKFRVFGETLDIGVGNFLDAFARYIGLGFPGGPKLEQLAKKSNNFIELPYSVKGMDVSFSGLLTNLKQKIDKGYKPEDLAYSLQEVAFAMLIEVAERAMAHLKAKELALGGGVACNTRLQQMAKLMCKQRKAKLHVPPNSLLVDNAAMIAWLGYLQYNAKPVKKSKIKETIANADIKPYERTDDVDVTWR